VIRETRADGKRVVVTGSQGFVGRHLRKSLARRGAVCIGVDRPGTGAEIEIDLSLPEFEPDAVWEKVGGKVEAVIYMAANITRTSSVDAAARSNLRLIAEAQVRLIEAGHARGLCSHVVDCSTFKIFGPQRQPEGIVAGTHPRRPDPYSYGSAKALAERLLAIASPRAGFTYSMVHPTCIYGPGQHLHNAIPLFLKACLAGEDPVVFGDGKSLRDDVYAPDLSDVLIEAALQKKVGSFHAHGEKARTILEVAELCCEAVAKIGGKAGLRPRLEAGKPPKWWLDQSFDPRATREAFDFQPTPQIDALVAEAKWIKEGAPKDHERFSS
jgi:nucleoside-diphosphate-sugar epimerase